MWSSKSINIPLALALAAYHRRRGTRVPDGDLGFRCPGCEQPLVARERVSERDVARFEHFDVNSTCRMTRFVIERANRSETLDRYLTPEVFRAVMRGYLTTVSDDRDDLDCDGDARVPSPLRPAPFDRSSSASVAEPDEDASVSAVARTPEGFHPRHS
jgi:hypothetical protein